MDPVWSDLLVDAERLTSLYAELPPLEGLLLRSVHLSPYGPGLTLRVELPRYPDRVPVAWAEDGSDRLEVQIHFRGAGYALDFAAAGALQVSHLNAYRSGTGNPYSVRRHFESRVDQRLYETLPPVTGRPFYDRP
ncbi:Imm50 family immunity protein [Streptomyces liangshanensis]|uniref:Uncharacterized protein n=1 Tax=Streptomyces liangshanensis TaxID=2717324 RepID=A0A6G9H383_9ACTN|nr:Imm50 family immunity protein [Streptomyces liangshanensis]QIQ04924.1 hypothetical protein HA039_23930 [Streptomyces liangshanensis]